MKGLTHIAGAAAAGMILASAADLTVSETISVTTCTMVASLLPDVDICTSKAGHMVAPASFIIQLFIGHRTMFHAPLLYAALFGFLFYRFPEQQLLLLAGAIGIASHVALDLLNPAGIPLLWPIRKTFRLASIRSGGLIDRVISGLLILATVIIALRHFGIA